MHYTSIRYTFNHKCCRYHPDGDAGHAVLINPQRFGFCTFESCSWCLLSVYRGGTTNPSPLYPSVFRVSDDGLAINFHLSLLCCAKLKHLTQLTIFKLQYELQLLYDVLYRPYERYYQESCIFTMFFTYDLCEYNQFFRSLQLVPLLLPFLSFQTLFLAIPPTYLW